MAFFVSARHMQMSATVHMDAALCGSHWLQAMQHGLLLLVDGDSKPIKA